MRSSVTSSLSTIQTLSDFVVRIIPRRPRLSIPDTRIRPELTTTPCSKGPMTQHVAHIGRCLAIAWDTAGSLDGARACIVGSEGQMHYPELVEHLAEIPRRTADVGHWRSEEHTSELQSLMRISYAV